MLTVRSVPSGARVTVDGTPIGTTPVEEKRIPARNVTIRLHKSGFAAEEFPLQIGAGRSTTISRNLQYASSTLEVDVYDRVGQPVRAEVYVDGEPLGLSPFSGLVKAGQHEVSVAAGEERSTRRVQLTGGSVKRMKFELAERSSAKGFRQPGGTANKDWERSGNSVSSRKRTNGVGDTTQRIPLEIYLERNRKSVFWAVVLSILFPPLGHHYRGAHKAGWGYTGAIAGGAFVGAILGAIDPLGECGEDYCPMYIGIGTAVMWDACIIISPIHAGIATSNHNDRLIDKYYGKGLARGAQGWHFRGVGYAPVRASETTFHTFDLSWAF